MAHDKFYWGDDPSKEPGQQHLDTAPPTGGDMLKTQYDQDNDGQVDSSAHATTAGTSTFATLAGGIADMGLAGVYHYYGTDAAGSVGKWPLPIRYLVNETADKVAGVDVAGNNKYYGTDGTGTPGFWDVPSPALDDITDVSASSPTDAYVLTWVSANNQWEPQPAPGAGGGEANTASNQGAGEGLFIQKTGVDLEFKSLVAGSNVSVTSDADEVFIAVEELTEYNETTATATSGTILRADGGIQGYTMTANTSFTFDLTDGQSLTLHLNGGDTWTATWPAITWVGGAAPTLTAADVLEFWYFNATLFGAYVGDV